MPLFDVDLPRTRRKTAALRRYLERDLLRDRKFVCCDRKVCKASRLVGHVFKEGTMSHVGRRFDLLRGEKPLRVVVVSQEAASRKVTLEDRYRQVHDVTGLACRYHAEQGHAARNPHMRGTTSALRVIFGKGLGSNWDDEWVYPAKGKPFHIFDGFALVNRLLCFAGSEGTSQGRATPTMAANCGRHLTATLDILKPTILILQGKAVTTWTNTIVTPSRIFTPNLHEAHMGQTRTLVCTFSHPAARGSLRWGDNPTAPYVTDVVEPTLREALRRS